jgi:hypothetical protein
MNTFKTARTIKRIAFVIGCIAIPFVFPDLGLLGVLTAAAVYYVILSVISMGTRAVIYSVQDG